MKKQFTDINPAYGAPRGRRSILDNPEATVHVFQVRMVDGDYDDGGAYWGGGEPLYCARSEESDWLDFVRAKDRNEACAKILSFDPGLKIVDEFPLEDMLDAYLACALWSSTDEHGNPLDSIADVDDIHPDSVEAARSDCQDFVKLCSQASIDLASIPNLDPASIGYDFWLTRNQHGAGFWDRGLGELGTRLTRLAQTYGPRDPWFGDDGKVRFE